jgi:hypothetical protein
MRVTNALVQAVVKAVAAGQDRYISLQAYIVPLLLLIWGLFSHQALSFQFLTKPLTLLTLPLAELAIVLSVVGLLLGTAIHVLLGERVEHWSSLTNMVQHMTEHVLVGTFSSAYFEHDFADGRISSIEPWFCIAGNGSCTPSFIGQLWHGSGFAEHFRDLHSNFFPSTVEVSEMEMGLGTFYSVLAPFLVYFALMSFVVASIIQAYTLLNHARAASKYIGLSRKQVRLGHTSTVNCHGRVIYG